MTKQDILINTTLVYYDRALYYKIRNFKKKYVNYLYYFDNYLIHFFYFFIYITAIELFGYDALGPALTIVLTIHGIYLIFQTMQKKYKFLNYLTITIFGSIVLKLYLMDLKDFSMIEKIVVFLVLGVSLLGSAYFFQKLKNKREE